MKLRLIVLIVVICFGTLTACITQVEIVPDDVEGESVSTPEALLPTQIPTATQPPPRVLTICSQEPGSLFLYTDTSSAARLIRQAIYDGPIDIINYQASAVILTKIPALKDGDAWLQPVEVAPGDLIMDIQGNWVALGEGVSYRPSGCTDSSCAQTYTDQGAVQMDTLVARYQLLPGIVWSDGQPLSASDSVFSFHVYQELFQAVSPELLRFTKTYLALDEQVVEWTGIPGYVGTLAAKFFSPLPAHQLDGMGRADLLASDITNRTPMGWGPYIVTEWVDGDHLTLDRNPSYFRASQGYPHFDHLVFRFFTDGNQAIDALVIGECDIVDRTLLNESHVPRLEEEAQAGRLQFYPQTGTTWELVAFGIDTLDDQRYDLFAQKEVRQAIAMCIDRQKIVAEVLDGRSVVPDTYVPPNHPLAETGLVTSYDPSAALQMLASVGWVDHDLDPGTPLISSGVAGIPDGTPFQFTYLLPADAERPQVGSMIQEDLARCGFGVALVPQDWEVLMASGPDGPLFGRRFELTQFAWASALDPACYLFTSAEIPGPYPEYPKGWGGANLAGYHNPEFDRACQQANLSLPESEASLQAHREAQAIFAQDLPVIPLYQRVRLVAQRPDMCSLGFDPAGYEPLSYIEWLDYGESCQ